MIRVTSASVRRGDRVVLRDVSLDVCPGEVLAVVGPNGAGKSTLLGLLAGDLAPAGGEVTMNGRDLYSLSVAERARRRAVLPQTPSLNFALTVRDVVALGRLPHEEGAPGAAGRAIVEDAIHRAHVAHLRDRLYTMLSGGERQRVQLARALAQIIGGQGEESRYLLLDEPTSSLDMAHQHQALSVARQVAADGCGVLAVLHDVNLAAQYADRIVLIAGGRAIACGRPHEVLTADLLGSAFGVRVRVVYHDDLDRPVIVADPLTSAPSLAWNTQTEQIDHSLSIRTITV